MQIELLLFEMEIIDSLMYLKLSYSNNKLDSFLNKKYVKSRNLEFSTILGHLKTFKKNKIKFKKIITTKIHIPVAQLSAGYF